MDKKFSKFDSKFCTKTPLSYKTDTRRFYVLMVCDGCYLHCGDDWVIFQSHVHFVGQE